MCLILLAEDIHPDYRLIVAANRDEFYDRPTAPMDFWEDCPDVLAGRDLQGGGTWLGVSRSGRFAALTNYREPVVSRPDAPSRGHLVGNFLSGNCPPSDYLEKVSAVGSSYSGYNLMVGDTSGLYYQSNRRDGVQMLTPGWYGLSNHLLNTPWPKVEKGLERFKTVVSGDGPIDTIGLFQLLMDGDRAPDDRLPHTGVSLEWERILSPMFIRSPGYGTRSSTVVLIDRIGCVQIAERTFTPESDSALSISPVRSFQISPVAVTPTAARCGR